MRSDKRTLKVSMTEEQYQEATELKKALSLSGYQLMAQGMYKCRLLLLKQQQQQQQLKNEKERQQQQS